MKLYTEEQVRHAIKMARSSYNIFTTPFIYNQDEVLQQLTPIQLPSDEEIDEYVKSTGYYGHCTHEYHEGIQEGAKYVINKIQGGKK
jgi:tRNA G26 N,N-dimethylase Trm1